LNELASEPVPEPRGRPGQRLGPYELLAPLGVGGMSEVFRARDTRLDREVAVKILDLEAARHPARLRLFEQEARAAGAIDHPAIVTVHDVGREGDLPYVVFELVEGETLQRRLDRGRLPVRRALEVAADIAAGLAAAHVRGILHNDLKPANVLLTSDGRVKILDFGLAGLRQQQELPPADDAGAREAATRALFGTPGYVAPERLHGAPPDVRSDVFSLGAVVYEMLAGFPPFRGTTSAAILAATSEEDPPGIGPPVPPAIERIVRRALENAPGRRFQSASDLAFALEAVTPPLPGAAGAGSRRRWTRPALGVAAGVALVAAGLAAGRALWDRPLPAFRRLTFRHGGVASARFAPDGRTVVYSAAWEGTSTLRPYSSRTDARGETEVAGPEGDVAAVSAVGEMALLLGRHYPAPHDPTLGPGETLARLSLAGGAPREILKGVVAADWSPDGAHLAVVREEGGRRRLEYPVGRILLETGYGLRAPRFSPRGDRIAIVEGSVEGHSVTVVDLEGRRKVLATGLAFTANALAWSPSGDEVWFSAEKLSEGADQGSWKPALRAVSLSGRERVLLRLPEYLSLQDVGPGGQVLLTVGTMRSEVIARSRGEERERNLSWHEGSSFVEVARDGSRLLFFEAVELATYLRPMDGGPAVRLCEGLASGLSPDGAWVVRIGMDHFTGRFTLLPTGAGEPRVVAGPKIAPWALRWFEDGRRFLVTGHAQDRPLRAWVVDTQEGTSRAITPEGIGCWLVSPDGGTAACARPEGEGYLYPTAGDGEARPIPGFANGDHLLQWSTDGRFLYVSERYARPARVLRLELATGRRTPWRDFSPSDSAGVVGTIDPTLTPDGSAWAYSVLRHLNDLYVVEGLR
jgi:hypothetical protein